MLLTAHLSTAPYLPASLYSTKEPKVFGKPVAPWHVSENQHLFVSQKKRVTLQHLSAVKTVSVFGVEGLC